MQQRQLVMINYKTVAKMRHTILPLQRLFLVLRCCQKHGLLYVCAQMLETQAHSGVKKFIIMMLTGWHDGWMHSDVSVSAPLSITPVFYGLHI